MARNACNLLRSVRQLFVTAEGIAVKGVREPASMECVSAECCELLSRLRRHHVAYLRRENRHNPLDHLGLRRVEIHNPPSLADILDFS